MNSLVKQLEEEEIEEIEEPDEDEDDYDNTCPTCNGCGEGRYDGSSCSDCGGSGVIKPAKEWDE